MKTLFRKLTVIGLLVMICFSVFSVSVSAAAKTSIIISNKSPKKGDSVTVTVQIQDSSSFDATEFDLTYNPDVLKYTGSESYASGGGGRVHVVESYDSKSKHSCTLAFSALKAGSSTIQVTNAIYLPKGASAEAGLPSAGYTLTVSDATKSGNANLKALSLSNGTLSPAFSASKTSYTATVPKNVEKCAVYATAEDSGAKISISGDSNLSIGRNTRKITVTAANGSQKVYTVTITRTKTEEKLETDSEENPYETTINDEAYMIASDLTGVAVPNGFTAASAEYRGAQVAVAKDKNEIYTLYYLKKADDETAAFVPYILESDSFLKLPCATFGNNTYIFSEFPEDIVAPAGYYTTTVEINGCQVLCYHEDNADPDFYYLYCFYSDDYGIYRYDKKEDVLQRYPEFVLKKTAEQLSFQNEEAPKKFTERFAALSAGAKIILFLIVAAILVFITLIVIAFIRLALSGKKTSELIEDNVAFAGEPDVFDEIQIDDDDNGFPEDE